MSVARRPHLAIADPMHFVNAVPAIDADDRLTVLVSAVVRPEASGEKREQRMSNRPMKNLPP